MVYTKSYHINPNIPFLTPPRVPPIKVLIQTQTLEVKEETTVDTEKSTTEIDFSKLLLNEIYTIQQAAAAKIRKAKHRCLTRQRDNKRRLSCIRPR